MKLLKKAAMFGLDARIALAIFGALSVISGAALYSAIQKSKLTTYVANVNEVIKSIEAFMLDTGQDLILGNVHTFDAEDLVVDRSSVTGWNGPYIPLGLPPADTNNHLIDFNNAFTSSTNLFVKRAPNTSWTDPDPVAGCDGTVPCYYWIETGCYDTSSVQLIDNEFDGSVDASAGKIRYTTCIDGVTYKMYYQGILTLNQGS